MATWDDVRRIAATLPESEHGAGRDGQQWRVGGKLYAWERPLRRSDVAALGAAAPDGPVLAARVVDEGVKDALIAENPDVYFTTPHFDGYPAILVRLDSITGPDLEDLLADAWSARAPKRLLHQRER
jgi:hypothetical protein